MGGVGRAGIRVGMGTGSILRQRSRRIPCRPPYTSTVPEGARWTRAEHLLAFELYCRTQFGRMHSRNPEVIALGKVLGRTPASVALKLVNFARLDPSLRERGVSGMTHGARGEEEVWKEFIHDPEALAVEAASLRGGSVEGVEEPAETAGPVGRDALTLSKRRIGQRFFRAAVLAAYDDHCCVTGVSIPELLMASHIVGWAVNAEQRTNPRNGLCLNALHDRAFDRLLMYIDFERRVRFARHRFPPGFASDSGNQWLLSFEGKAMREPKKFLPDPEFLGWHRERSLSTADSTGATGSEATFAIG